MIVGIQPPIDPNTEEGKRKIEARQRSIANLRPAKPGEVRNPRGRPKKDIYLANLAQKHAERAIATLVSVMTDTEATAAARVSAASEILDRGFGRAPQSLDVSVDFTEQFEDFLRSMMVGRNARVING